MKALIVKDMKGGNSCMDKKGQAVLGVTIFVLLLVLLGGLVFIGYQAGWFSNIGGGGGGGGGGDDDECSTAPNVSVSVVNEYAQSTTVSPTVYYRVNGQYLGTTAPTSYQKGADVELLLSAANYLDKKLPSFKAECGNKVVSAKMLATDTNTFRVFNTDGNPLTDNAAANATAGHTVQSTSAAPINLNVFIDSKVKESTGNLIIVVEAENTTQVKDIILSGNGATGTGVDVPNFYSPVLSGSAIDAFRVPELLNGESKQFTLQLTPESGQTIGLGNSSVYITAYSEQDFVDTDGTYKTGVEDSDGTAQYEDTWDFDFCIGSICA